MSKTALFIIGVFGVFGTSAFAQTAFQNSRFANTTSAETVADQLKLTFSATTQTAADSALGLKSNDQSGFKFAVDGAQSDSLGEGTQSLISFRLQSLNSQGDLLLGLPQAFISGQDRGKDLVVWTLGRQKSNYSRVDQMLEMGIINPLLTADQIHFEQQGLTGLHLAKTWGAFSARVSALMAYLPNQGPGVREDNGRLIAANRWSATPPEKLRFNSELKEINYKLTDIDYQKIVNHQGIMAGFDWTFEKSALKTSFGRLPMNDLVIAREIYADLQVRPQVNLTPVVTDQNVLAADYTMNVGAALVSAGVIFSDPDNKTAPAGLETQEISASTTSAVSLEYPLNNENLFLKSVSLAASETQGGDIEDLDSQGEKSDFILVPQRFKFNKPIQLKARLGLWESRRQKVQADVKFIYDREQKGSLLDSEVIYQTALTGLSVSAGVTVIGVNESSNTSETDDKRFLFQNQVNDRVYGGVNYEF